MLSVDGIARDVNLRMEIDVVKTKVKKGVPIVAQGKRTQLVPMRMWV